MQGVNRRLKDVKEMLMAEQRAHERLVRRVLLHH